MPLATVASASSSIFHHHPVVRQKHLSPFPINHKFPELHTAPSILFHTGSLPFAPDRHKKESRTTYNTRSTPMGKSQDARKETKKKPAKTMKEKRAEKKAKK
jgi:hypothetical protein